MFPSPNRTASGRQGLLVTPLRANVNSASSDENGLPGLTDTSHSRQGSASILSPMLSSPSKPRDTSPGSVDSRESIASAQALIISRGKSRENLTAGGDPSKQNRMDRILSANKADATRTKDEIGKTLGVPNLKGLIGRAPIRSAISRHGDSGTNLIHLRVTTPADPPDSAAISLLKVSSTGNCDMYNSGILTSHHRLILIAKKKEKKLQEKGRRKNTKKYVVDFYFT